MTNELPYHVVHVVWDHEDYCEEYSVLEGPDGWECMLGEPEDCTWSRDGSKAVKKLNEQHARIQKLEAQIIRLFESEIL